MFSGKLFSGDHNSVGQELLEGVSELETKCAAIELAVSDGYFSLNKALKIYKVSETEYLAYQFYKNSLVSKTFSKEKQLVEAINSIIFIYSSQSDSLNEWGKKALNELQHISKEVGSHS